MSGIYFPGARMPLFCAACKYRGWCAVWKDNDLAGHIRSKDCPLIEVPDHGRLGDLDELIADLQPTDENIRSSGADLMLAVFVEVLKSCPTIIPASKKSAEERAAGGVGPYEETEGERT